MNDNIQFGKDFREKYYQGFGADVVPVNHGSYGATSDPVYAHYFEDMKKDYNFPDQYLRNTVLENYSVSLKAIGELVHCDYHSLALVANATTGVNVVLRSYPFAKGDKIVIANTTYGACVNTVKFLADRYGIEIVVIDLNYPLEDDAVIQEFERVFSLYKPKLALFDTISSMPGVRVPFERLVELCRNHDVLSLVDGAHSIGMIPLDLGKLQADFFTSNGHKWLGVPRGCAILYVDPHHWHHIHTLPVSHSYLKDSTELSPELEQNWLIDRFKFTGTNNFASFTVIPKVLEWRRSVGGEEAIHDYCFKLAREVGELVSKKWGTTVLDNRSNSLVTAMVTVEVPLDQVGLTARQMIDNSQEILDHASRFMIEEKRTFVPWIIHNNRCYARFSCQVYNHLEEYDFAADQLIIGLKLAAETLKYFREDYVIV